MVAGIPGAPSTTAWQLFIKDPQAQLTAFKKQPQIQKEIDYLKEKFSKFESVEDLTNDYRAMKVVLSAFQLEDEINFKARNEKIIEQPWQGEEAEDSLVNQLIDPRYMELAQTFDFQGRGNNVFISGPLLNEIIDRYVVNEFEKSLGETNPGLREAAYFARTVNGFSNTFQLLGNNALRAVIEGGLDLPDQFAGIDIDQQARVIEQRLDVEDFFADKVTDGTDPFELRSAKANVGILRPLKDTTLAAVSTVQNVLDQITAIQERIGEIGQQTDPLGANAAEVAFQNAEMPNVVTSGLLIKSATQATSAISKNLAELRDIYRETVGSSDPVLIADNQQRYADLVDRIVTELNNAGATHAETGVPHNLLLDGAGPNIQYQLTSTSSQVTINAYDLNGFLADLQTAATDFSAGNFTAADNLVLASRGSFYAARNDLENVSKAFDKNVAAVDMFVATVDRSALEPALDSLLASERDANSAVNIVGRLYDLAQALSDASLVGADRTELEQQFTELQGRLDDLLNPPDPDNYLTNSGTSVTLNPNLTFNISGIDFNDAGLYPEIDPARMPADAADAAALALEFADYKLELEALSNQLGTEREQLQLINNRYDPYGAVYANLQNLTDSLEDLREGARGDFGELESEQDEDGKFGINFLSPGAADGSVNLTNGIRFTTHGAGDYVSQVEDVIKAANALIRSDRAGATALLTDAYVNGRSIVDQLKLDLRPQQAALQRFNAVIAEAEPPEPEETSSYANPYDEANQFTLDFIQRYLVLNDLQNQQTASNPLLALFNPSQGYSVLPGFSGRDGIGGGDTSSGLNLLI